MDGGHRPELQPEDDPDCPGSIRRGGPGRWPGMADAARPGLGPDRPSRDEDGIWETSGDPCDTGSGEIERDHPGRRPASGRRSGSASSRVATADPTRADEVVIAPVAAANTASRSATRVFILPRRRRLVGARRHGASRTGDRGGHRPDGVEVPPKKGFYIQSLHPRRRRPAGIEATQAEDVLAADRRAPGGRRRASSDCGSRRASSRSKWPSTCAVDAVDEGLQSDANALWLVALLGGVAAVLRARAHPHPLPGRRGGDRREPRRPGLVAARTASCGARLHGLAIGTVAATIAVVVVLLVSTRTPIGDARAIEPVPGAELDGVVTLCGRPGHDRPRDGDPRGPGAPVAGPRPRAPPDAGGRPRQPRRPLGPGRARDPHRARAGAGPGPGAVLGLRRGPRGHRHHRCPRLHQQRPAPPGDAGVDRPVVGRLRVRQRQPRRTGHRRGGPLLARGGGRGPRPLLHALPQPRRRTTSSATCWPSARAPTPSSRP